MTSIESRLPRADYDAIQAVSVTRLKELKRSPQHYQHALTNPRRSDALTLGIATHVAVLEPERFLKDFAIWERRTEADAMAPRRGKAWDEFCEANEGKSILTADEAAINTITAGAPSGALVANAAALLQAVASTGDLAAAIQTMGYLNRAAINLG